MTVTATRSPIKRRLNRLRTRLTGVFSVALLVAFATAGTRHGVFAAAVAVAVASGVAITALVIARGGTQ